MLRLINVTPLLVEHCGEIVRDLRENCRRGIVNEVAFCFSMVPEGAPPLSKAAALGAKYRRFREELGTFDYPVGILVQSLIGHGWVLNAPNAFQQQVSVDGREISGCCCPLDPGFRQYVSNVIRELAALRPDFMMIDDDFRLVTGRNACLCPLHLAAFGQRTGRTLTQEELAAHLRGSSEEDCRIAREFDAVNADSLYELARIVREAIDAVDPAIPGSFCTCSGDVRYASTLAKILAGDGNPPVVRINNARYLQEGQRNFAFRMYQGAAQIAALDGVVQILAETDTFPQNRYSTGAAVLHANFTGSLLEGCDGAKHWITRMREYEPESGIAYREILARHARFYEELHRTVAAGIRWCGPATPLPEQPLFNWNPPRHTGVDSLAPLGVRFNGRMGLPCHFRRAGEGAAMLSADECGMFSDAEIRRFLAAGMLLDGGAAAELERRGFSALTGVSIGRWEEKRQISGEILAEHPLAAAYAGRILSPLRFSEDGMGRIIPLNDRVEVVSQLFFAPYSQSDERHILAPGCTVFSNELGGRVVVFAGTQVDFNVWSSTRKLMLTNLLNWLEPFVAWYPEDAECYLKAGRCPDGSVFVAVINLGLDPLPELPLASPETFDRCRRLTADGRWEPVEMAPGTGEIRIRREVAPMMPEVFMLR